MIRKCTGERIEVIEVTGDSDAVILQQIADYMDNHEGYVAAITLGWGEELPPSIRYANVYIGL